MRALLFVLAAVLLMGCGAAETQSGAYKPGAAGANGDFLGAVTKTAGSAKSCTDFFMSGTHTAAQTEAAKKSIKTSYPDASTTQCVTSGNQGYCSLSTTGNTGTVVSTQIYFFGLSASDLPTAKANCTDAGATWTASK